MHGDLSAQPALERTQYPGLEDINRAVFFQHGFAELLPALPRLRIVIHGRYAVGLAAPDETLDVPCGKEGIGLLLSERLDGIVNVVTAAKRRRRLKEHDQLRLVPFLPL